MAISPAFDIATSALNTFQAGLNVTADNISNVDTPDYCTQSAILEVANPENTSQGIMGRGVSLEAIQRSVNTFATNQLQTTNSSLGMAAELNSTYSTVEQAFNEQLGSGIGSSLTNFYNAWQDVSTSPATPEQRTELLTNAQTFINEAQSTEQTLTATQTAVQQDIPGVLTQINNYANQIANLNAAIANIQAGSTQQANDYLDQRDGALKSLAKLVNFSSYENSTNQVTVMVGGRNLVGPPFIHPLSMNQSVDGKDTITMDGMDVTKDITGGQLGGLLTVNNSDLTGVPAALADLRRAVGSVTNETNMIQSTGFGLNAQQSDFTIKDNTPATTTAGSISSTSITNFANFEPGYYTIQFNSPNTYNVFRNGQSFASNVSFSAGAINFDGMNLTFGGTPQTGDNYYVSATGKNLFNPLTTTVTALGNSQAQATATTFDPAAMTYKEYNVTFTGTNTYQMTDIATNPPVTTNGTLNANNSIIVDGMEVNFSGLINTGDTFKISPVQGAISSAGVAITKTDDVAAAGSSSASPGDNANALLINTLQDTPHAANSALAGQSSTQYYNSLVTIVGNLSKNASDNNTFETNVMGQLQQTWDSTSGVNLDQEALNMVSYQKGYEAAAKLVSTASDMLDSLMALAK